MRGFRVYILLVAKRVVPTFFFREVKMMSDFEMTEEEFMECERAEAREHDDKVRELERKKYHEIFLADADMDVDISVEE